MSTTNMYLLLDIFKFDNNLVGNSDNDQAVIAVIQSALKAKEAQWSKESNTASSKAEVAKINMERSKNALKNLSTQADRKACWEEAKQLVETEINKTLKIFLIRGYLVDSNFDAIIKKIKDTLGVTLERKDIELFTKNVEVRKASKTNVPSGKELKPEGINETKYKNNNGKLQTLGYSSLYDLLAKKRKVTKIKSTPTDMWRQWADEDNKALPNKSSEEVSFQHDLLNFCITSVFDSEKSRQDYDNYLAYKDLKSKLDDIKLAYASDKNSPQPLDNASANQFIKEMLQIASQHNMQLTRKDMVEYILFMCAKAKIPYNPPELSQSEEKSVAYYYCPWCGVVINENDVACASCGGKIKVTCVKCGASNRADDKFCSNCGKNYADLQKATALCAAAENELSYLRFDKVELLLDSAQSLWKDLEDIDKTRIELHRQQKLIGTQMNELNDAIKKKQFMRAQRTYVDIRKQYAQYNDAEIEEKIKDSISQAQAILSSNGGLNNLTTALRAYEVCSDYTGLATAFAKNTPQATGTISVISNTLTHENNVTWQPSRTTPVIYVLVKKKGSAPISIDDGDIIARTSSTSFTDTNVESASEYYYAVAATCGPMSSSLIVSKKIVNYFDVTSPRVSPSNESLQITWSKQPANSSIEVWRNENHTPQSPGDGIKVANVVNGGLLDSNLLNNTTYYYTIYAVYQASDGTTKYSRGVSCSGTPITPPEPIDFMIPQLQKDRSFTLQWNKPSTGESKFYYTNTAPKFSMEDSIPESELSAKAMPLSVKINGDGKGTFTLPDDNVYYIIAATVKNGTALVGATATVSSKEAVTINKITASNTNAFVIFDWPNGSEHVALAWRGDRFPIEPFEKGNSRKIVNQKTYNLKKGITVDGLSSADTYYFSLFAELGSGDSASYSAGSNKTFSFGKIGKATYYIDVTKSLFAGIRSAKLIIESNCPLPETELRIQKAGVPVFRTQGKLILNNQAIKEAGITTIDIPTSLLARDMYYKLFFKNDDDYQSIDLVTKANKPPKIGK